MNAILLLLSAIDVIIAVDRIIVRDWLTAFLCASFALLAWLIMLGWKTTRR